VQLDLVTAIAVLSAPSYRPCLYKKNGLWGAKQAMEVCHHDLVPTRAFVKGSKLILHIIIYLLYVFSDLFDLPATSRQPPGKINPEAQNNYETSGFEII